MILAFICCANEDIKKISMQNTFTFSIFKMILAVIYQTIEKIKPKKIFKLKNEEVQKISFQKKYYLSLFTFQIIVSLLSFTNDEMRKVSITIQKAYLSPFPGGPGRWWTASIVTAHAIGWSPFGLAMRVI